MNSAKKKRILCYGDSNTYGCIPGGFGRYSKHTRWTGRLAKALGPDYEIVEVGLNGRTTAFDDQAARGRNGESAIASVAGFYKPFDLLIVMLGSNDCKTQFHASASDIGAGLERVIRKAQEAGGTFRTLLIAPPVLEAQVTRGSFGNEFDRTSVARSRELSETFRGLAEKLGCAWLDASQEVRVSAEDGLHLDEEGHAGLAQAVASAVRALKL